MGQAQLCQSRRDGLVSAVLGCSAQDHGRQTHQAANRCRVVSGLTGALVRWHATGPVGKKVSVVRLGIGVVVAVGRGHEVHIVGQKVCGVVPLLVGHGAHDQPGAQGVQGVFTRLHALVVMAVGRAPVVFLALENDFADHFTRLCTATCACRARQRHDGTGVVRFGRLEVAHLAKVALQIGQPVVPMHRHGQGVAHQHAPQSTTDAVSGGQSFGFCVGCHRVVLIEVAGYTGATKAHRLCPASQVTRC